MPARRPGTLAVLAGPSLLPLHLLGAVVVVAAVLMGRWQIGVWHDVRAQQAVDLTDQPPLPLAEVLGPDDAFPADGVGRPVTAAGAWLPAETVFVPRAQGGDDGVWMVTPLSVCATACSSLPVVLGWAPDREAAPDPPTGEAEVSGPLQPPETGARDDDPTDDVVPSLRTTDLLPRASQDLYGGFLVLDRSGADGGGLRQVEVEAVTSAPAATALRNLLYGLEWWAFAAVAAYLWWRWSRDAVIAARLPSEP